MSDCCTGELRSDWSVWTGASHVSRDVNNTNNPAYCCSGGEICYIYFTG